MITIDEFLSLAADTPEVRRNLRDRANSAQLDAVLHNDDRLLMLAAGPGSGKTTVLVLRGLRHMLVDCYLPEHILFTTFTRKAAKELRTRWLDWGTALVGQLAGRVDDRALDLNRCRIDTLDSIAQQALAEHRLPGMLAPVVAEMSASKLILKRSAFASAYQNPVVRASLDGLFSRYTFDGSPPNNQGEALGVAKSLCDRLIQDQVDVFRYRNAGEPEGYVSEILDAYRDRMVLTNVFDFASLQETFLSRLNDGTLTDWLDGIRLVLIDEYQDTNPLQEAIYFNIIRNAHPMVTVVGDDDQSMYRFRGGSVELFTEFSDRALASTGRDSLRVDMVRNFRSSPEIVDFYNRHITADPEFAPARIAPSKPEVIAHRQGGGLPVFGMFRPDAATLAEDLSQFLSDLRTRRRVTLVTASGEHRLELARDGNLGDAVFLSHSVEEERYNRPRGQQPATLETRFPGLLRASMFARDLEVFNPRGLALRVIPNVQRLLGLLALCIDADGSALDEAFPTNEARHFVNLWRASAQALVTLDPTPNDGTGIRGFIAGWNRAEVGIVQREFPRSWPVLELVFKLITWIPEFQTDAEHQVWLEAITRIISSASMASPYGMQLMHNTPAISQTDHVRRSRLSLLRDALFPIAEDEVDVDEDIMPSVPRNRLQVMTIHQSKGLEFPMVIVDVGSHFSRNHQGNRFRRHPIQESNVARMEDDVEPYLRSPLRAGRTMLHRTFDDLVRLYYVAYSRPQSVLLLVGNEACLRYGSGANFADLAIPNVALGWRRDGQWPWRQSFQGNRPPVSVEPPIELIGTWN